MKVSLIVAVYKDVEALNIILESLQNQTYKNFEVLVAEDGDSKEMAQFLQEKREQYFFELKHTTQEDNGVQKSKSQNNAIRSATGEYLIFIDGDCVLYKRFIENHLSLSDPKNVITGRRVNLGPLYSKKLRLQEITPLWLEEHFLIKYFDIAKDAKEERHTEEGFQIKPNGMVAKLMRKVRKKEIALLGCNMSCYKEAMVAINGFDEALGNAAVAGDTDLEWRFKGLGYRRVSAKNIANQFHLYHERKPQDYERGMVELMLENKKNRKYRCEEGIIKN